MQAIDQIEVEFAALLASRYVLEQTGDEDGIAWRFYLKSKRSSGLFDELQASR